MTNYVCMYSSMRLAYCFKLATFTICSFRQGKNPTCSFFETVLTIQVIQIRLIAPKKIYCVLIISVWRSSIRWWHRWSYGFNVQLANRDYFCAEKLLLEKSLLLPVLVYDVKASMLVCSNVVAFREKENGEKF